MGNLRSVITFQVREGRENDFEAAFTDAGMLTRPAELEGFEGAELIRCIEDPCLYMVVGAWSTQASYQDWQARSLEGVAPDVLKRLGATLIEAQPGQLFKIVG